MEELSREVWGDCHGVHGRVSGGDLPGSSASSHRPGVRHEGTGVAAQRKKGCTTILEKRLFRCFASDELSPVSPSESCTLHWRETVLSVPHTM